MYKRQVEITAAELLYWLNYNTEVYLSQFGGYFPQLPWETDLGDGTTMADEMKQGSLEAAAYYAILPTVADKEGLSVEPSTVEQLESTQMCIRDRVQGAERKKADLLKEAEAEASSRKTNISKEVEAEEYRLQQAQQATAAFVEKVRALHAQEAELLDKLQTLYPPETTPSACLLYTSSAQEQEVLLTHQGLLEEFGFELDPLGQDLAVRQAPFDVDTGDIPATLEELAQRLLTTGGADPSAAPDG